MNSKLNHANYKCNFIVHIRSLMQLAVVRLNVIFSLSLFTCDLDRDLGISFPDILIVSFYYVYL